MKEVMQDIDFACKLSQQLEALGSWNYFCNIIVFDICGTISLDNYLGDMHVRLAIYNALPTTSNIDLPNTDDNCTLQQLFQAL